MLCRVAIHKNIDKYRCKCHTPTHIKCSHIFWQPDRAQKLSTAVTIELLQPGTNQGRVECFAFVQMGIVYLLYYAGIEECCVEIS